MDVRVILVTIILGGVLMDYCLLPEPDTYDIRGEVQLVRVENSTYEDGDYESHDAYVFHVATPHGVRRVRRPTARTMLVETSDGKASAKGCIMDTSTEMLDGWTCELRLSREQIKTLVNAGYAEILKE
jgi:hypothetical protein